MDTSLTRRRLLQGTLGALLAWSPGIRVGRVSQSAAAQKNTPSGQMTWAVHVTLAPSWLDPSETPRPRHPLYAAVCGARRPAQAHAR